MTAPDVAVVAGPQRSGGGTPRELRLGRFAWQHVVPEVLAWAASVPVLHAVFADADRGLDAMDESHYLLAAQPWASDKAYNGVWGWYSGPMLRLVGDDLGRLRVIAGLILVAAALLLARSVRQACEELAAAPWPGWLRAIWPAGMTGAALCYYDVFVRTPSYNWFAAVGLLLLAAGLLRTLTGQPALATGVCVAAGAFVTAIGKATTGLAATAIALAAVLIHVLTADRAGRRHVRQVAVATVGTAVVLVGAHALFVNSLPVTLATYRRITGMLAAVDPEHYATGVAVNSALRGVQNELIDRPTDFLRLLLVPVVVAAVAYLGARRPGRWLAVAQGVAWLVPLWVTLRDYPGGVPGLGMSVSPLVVAAEAGVVTAVVAAVWHSIPGSSGGAVSGNAAGSEQAARPERVAGSRKVVGPELVAGPERVAGPGAARPWLAVLLAVTLLGMGAAYPIGTNVEYATQLPGGFPILLAAGVLGVACIPGDGRLAAIAVLAAGSILIGGVFVTKSRDVAPYRIATLDQQTIPRSIVPGTPPVLVEQQTADWIDGLRALGRQGGFVPATPVLDLTWHPMSVMILDGRAPKTLIPAFPGWQQPGASAAYTLAQEDPRVWRAAWILEPQGQDDAIADQATSVIGLRFPDDYELVGSVTAPYDRQVQALYRPRSRV